MLGNQVTKSLLDSREHRATAVTRFHRIFREALDAVKKVVGDASADDSDRAELVGSYYDIVLRLLHAHHEAEDMTIYPQLVAPLPEHIDVINRVNAEHEVVLGSLEAAEQAVAAWRANPSSVLPRRCGGRRPGGASKPSS